MLYDNHDDDDEFLLVAVIITAKYFSNLDRDYRLQWLNENKYVTILSTWKKM